MSIVTIGTPFNIDLEFKIAGFGKRFLAWGIDIIIICVYFYMMLRFLYPVFEKNEAISISAVIFVIIIPILLYQLMFELFFNGQTLGKKVAGIAVIDVEGREPTISQYLLRWVLCIGNLFVYIVPFIILTNPGLMIILLVLYLPDFLSVVISAKSQRLGDFAAGTVVIDKRYRPDISETVYLQIENEDYKPMFPQVMRLTDRDINGIKNLTEVKKPGKDAEAYAKQVVAKIKTVLEIDSDMEPAVFLNQLLQDYNYYTTRGTNH